MKVLRREDLLERAGLSARSTNALRSVGLRTIGELLDYDGGKLVKIRNIGVKSIYEINIFRALVSLENELCSCTCNAEIALVPISEPKNYVCLCEILLEELEFSLKSYIYLKRMGYDFASQLIGIDDKSLKAAGEISSSHTNEILEKIKILKKLKGLALHKEEPIEKLGLSVRATNALIGASISTVGKLLDYDRGDLPVIKSLGAKSVEEINSFLSLLFLVMRERDIRVKEMIKVHGRGNVLLDSNHSRIKDVAFKISEVLGLRWDVIYEEILPLFLQSECIDKIEMKELFAIKLLRNTLKQRIIENVSEKMLGIERDDIYSMFPREIVEQTTLSDVIRDMEAERRIIIKGNRIECYRMTVLEFISTIVNKRDKEILLKRFQGYTLNEIGEQYGVSKERIRQIIKRNLACKPVLYEDRYEGVLEKYDLSMHDFMRVYNVDESAYYYLSIVRKEREERTDERFVNVDAPLCEVEEKSDLTISEDIAPAIEKNKKQDMAKLTKQGLPKRSGGKRFGGSTLTYPIKDKEELARFTAHFEIEAKDTRKMGYKSFVSARNYLIVTIGLNTAYKVKDVISLKWSDIFSKNGDFIEAKVCETSSKHNNYYINDTVKSAITVYLRNRNVQSYLKNVTGSSRPKLNDYIFFARNGGKEHININTMRLLIKEAAEKVGITYNVGNHTLRKTFLFHTILDKPNSIPALMEVLGYNSEGMMFDYAMITIDDLKIRYKLK